jgi:hypothetical protein
MRYPYNTIFRRGLLNTFKAALHSGYLCLKIPVTFRVIFVFGSQKDARNIEHGIVSSHKNVHFLREELDQYQQPTLSVFPAPANYRMVKITCSSFEVVLGTTSTQ